MSARAVCSTVALVASLLIGRPTAAFAAPDLASVRELYASASYAEALEVLGGIDGADNTEVEQYRALCLLGLGRTGDAEQALERIVMRRPLYVMPAGEVSPRLVTLFHEVRRRSLPAITWQVYARAKASYDGKDHKAAAEQFRNVLALVNDPDAASQATALAELKQLTEGFLALSEAAVTAAAAPPPPPPVAVAVAEPPAKPQAGPRVYTSADADVVAPVALNRAMPVWKPPSLLIAQQSFRGVLEVVINERGQVEWAGMSKGSFPSYDTDLVLAAKEWRFRPATKSGAPVKYRLAVEVVLLAGRED